MHASPSDQDSPPSPPRLSKAQELYASALSPNTASSAPPTTSLGPTSLPPGAALSTPPSAGIMSVSMSQPVYSSVLPAGPASAALPSVGTQLYRPQQSSSPQTAASPASPPVGASLPTPPGVYATGSLHSASPPASNVQYSPQAFAAPIPILQGAPVRPVSGNTGYQQPIIYSQPLPLQPQASPLQPQAPPLQLQPQPVLGSSDRPVSGSIDYQQPRTYSQPLPPQSQPQPPKSTHISFFGSPKHTAAPTFTPVYTLPPQPLSSSSPLPTDPSSRKARFNATDSVKALWRVGRTMFNFAGDAIQATTGVPPKTLLSNDVASALGNILNSINNDNASNDNGNDTNTDALGLGLGILQTNLQAVLQGAPNADYGAAAMQQTTSLGQVASSGQGQIGLVGQGVPGVVVPNGQVHANNALLQTHTQLVGQPHQLGTTGVGVQNQQAQTVFLQGINQLQQSAPAPGFMAQAQHIQQQQQQVTGQVLLQQGHQAYRQPQYPPASGPHTPPTQAQTTQGAPPPGFSTSVHLSGSVSATIQSQSQPQPQPTLMTPTGSAQGTRPPPVNAGMLSGLAHHPAGAIPQSSPPPPLPLPAVSPPQSQPQPHTASPQPPAPPLPLPQTQLPPTSPMENTAPTNQATSPIPNRASSSSPISSGHPTSNQVIPSSSQLYQPQPVLPVSPPTIPPTPPSNTHHQQQQQRPKPPTAPTHPGLLAAHPSISSPPSSSVNLPTKPQPQNQNQNQNQTTVPNQPYHQPGAGAGAGGV
ncbi:hypothetical protein J132_04519 [Termitomyces sp. J132]|nr:hypothetical protein J132_04519 [Termitomyces sp. J132]